VVAVGSGIELAKRVAKKIGRGAYLSVFKNFGTAQVKAGDLEKSRRFWSSSKVPSSTTGLRLSWV